MFSFLKKYSRSHLVEFIIFFLVIAVIRFHPFLTGKTLFFGDNYSLMVPGKIFMAHWLKLGTLPLWNPHIFSGVSLIGDINQSLLYPSTLLFVIFSPALALNLTVIIHLLLMMLGTYLLIRKLGGQHLFALLGAAMMIVSPRVTGASDNLTILQSLTWMPWIVFLGQSIFNSSKSRYLLSGVIFLQILSGYPQHLIFSLFLTVLFQLASRKVKITLSFFKKFFTSWLQVGVVAVLMSAVVLLPFIETFLSSTRIHQTNIQATGGSLHPLETIKIVFPYIFEHPSSGMRWGPSWNDLPQSVIYLTILGLGIMILNLRQKHQYSRLVKVLAISSSLLLVFSFGRFLPFYSVMQNLLPILRVGRNPGLVLEMINLMVIVWLSLVLPEIKISKTFTKKLIGFFSLVAIVTVAGFLLVRNSPALVWQYSNVLTAGRLMASPFHNLERWQGILEVNFWYLFISSFLLVVALASLLSKRWRLLIAVLVIDTIIHTQGGLFFAPASIYDSPLKIEAGSYVETLQNPQFRTLTRNMNQSYTDFGSYWEALRVRKPFSDSFIDRREITSAELLERLALGMTPAWNVALGLPIVNGYTTLVPHDYERLWNNNRPGITALDKIDIEDPLLKDWAVKYYLVDTWFYTPEDLSKYEIVAEQDWWRVYELEALSRFRWLNDTPLELKDFTETPNKIEFAISGNRDQTKIIVADRYDKNWRAWVNGVETDIENFRGMRLLKIGAGEVEVTLKYIPRLFYLGLAISTVSFLMVIGFLLIKIKKNNG